MQKFNTVLSPKQKAEISILAKTAWENRPAAREAETLEQYRRAEQAKAGAPSLRTATQRDYLPLRAHFLELCGEHAAQFNTVLREVQDEGDLRIARHKLKETLAERGLHPSYASAIAKGKFGDASLDNLTRDQTWQLIFTLRKRKKAKDK